MPFSFLNTGYLILIKNRNNNTTKFKGNLILSNNFGKEGIAIAVAED